MIKKLLSPKSMKDKIIILVFFIGIFTTLDLFVKFVVEKNLRSIPEQITKADFENKMLQLAAAYNFEEILKDSYTLDGDTYRINKLNNVQKNKLWKKIRNFYPQREITVIKDGWSFIYETNEDIGFSILRSLDKILNPESKRIFLTVLQLTGSAVVIIFFFMTKESIQLYPIALIVAGALGNALDRFIRGYVVDYVMWTFSFIPHPLFNPWPIFNLADSFTVVGAIALIIILFITDSKSKKIK